MVITRLRRRGLSPRLLAISGIATAIIVESSPSIKKAQPMTSGISILRRGRLFAPSERLVCFDLAGSAGCGLLPLAVDIGGPGRQ